MEAFHREFEALSKKTPNATLNPFKLKIVNQALDEANNVLGKDFLPLRGFTQFEDQELPSNSDVSMVLAQYLEAMEVIRCRNIKRDSIGRWCWQVEDGDYESMLAAEPRMGMRLG